MTGSFLNHAQSHSMRRRTRHSTRDFAAPFWRRARHSKHVFMFVFMCAINITMYLLLREEFPCATGLGSCSTISCICANVYAEGCAL